MDRLEATDEGVSRHGATRPGRGRVKGNGAKRPELRLVRGGLGELGGAPAPTAATPAHRRARQPSTGREARRLVLLTAALSAFGLVIVLSASSVASLTADGSPWSLFIKQALWTAIGGVAFLVATRVDLTRLRRFAVPFLLISAALLVAVLAPGLGRTAEGSSRWIGAGPLRLQPSELAKLAFAIFAADLIARRAGARDETKAIVIPTCTVLGVMALLILRQPDMGTAVVLCCLTASMLYVSGVKSGLLLRLLVVLSLLGGVVALWAPYRRARLLSFFDPFAHASTSGYQVVQSLVALGSGHLTGSGLGGSVAKWGFLPNAWTDFVFAIIGNELGLVGSLAVLAAFAWFTWLGIRIASRTADRFQRLLATGITCWVAAQAVINVGGVIGIMPETGIPLPFLSSGGSSLVVVLAAVGLLVNIARQPARRAGAPSNVDPSPRRRQMAPARAKRSS